MSFIENLARDDWRAFMRRTLTFTLEILRTDRFRVLGSSADDLRAWLTQGGVPGVRRALIEQMNGLRLDPPRQAEVLGHLADLASELQPQLLELFGLGLIPTPATTHESDIALSPEFIQALLRRLAAGGRPFEEWMRNMGRSEADIAAVYQSIDEFLIREGLVESLVSADPGDFH